MSRPDLPPSPEPLPAPTTDAHTHLTSTREYSGLSPADAVARARAVGVTRLVDVGTDVASSAQAVGLARELPGVVAAIAIHPNDAARLGERLDDDLDRLAGYATDTGVRAVGETGLDYFRTRDAVGQALQRHAFAAHIALARQHDLALVIHDRDAHDDVVDVLDAEGAPDRVMMHCFSGDAGFARRCLDRGFWLSFPGTVTFKPNEPLREAFDLTPADRLLVETDAPYLTPVPLRGKPNASYLMPLTVRFLAERRGVDLAALCTRLADNATAVFGQWGDPDEPAGSVATTTRGHGEGDG
ncbi:MAG: TatD family hydrolase [Propionicimonas sp.]